MPFARPSLDDLVAQSLADIASALQGADPALAQNVLNVIGITLAEMCNSLYGYLDYIALQAVPFTAIDEAFAAWAALKRERQKPPVAATASWAFAATEDGLRIPDQASIKRSDGAAYTVQGDAVSAGGSVVAAVTADAPGAAGTVTTGVSGVLAAPIGGITPTGVGTAGTPGADLEDFGAFKTRVLAIFAAPPQGGDYTDYVEWAQSVPGVTRAWCKPNGQGRGTVVVFFMMDEAEAAFGGFPQGTNGVAAAETLDTPATGDQLTVANYIFPRQPVTAVIYANAPLKNTAAFAITLANASAALQTAVAKAIDALFLQSNSPGGVLVKDLSTGLLVEGGVTELSAIEAAIAAVPGTGGFIITAITCDHGTVNPAGVGDITANAGYLTVRGAVTWTT